MVNELIANDSQSSNSENGDHTYNPYSFKRLQDAIFKKESGATNTTPDTEKPTHKDSSQFLPLQRKVSNERDINDRVETLMEPAAQFHTAKQASDRLDMPLQM